MMEDPQGNPSAEEPSTLGNDPPAEVTMMSKMDLNSNEKTEELSITNGNKEQSESEVVKPAQNPEEEVINEDKNIEESRETKVAVRKYSYPGGQWSPSNPQGKKQYDIDFLMQLRDDPNSLKKPNNFAMGDLIRGPNESLGPDGSRSLPGLGKSIDLFPAFGRNQRSFVPNRRSQQGKPNGRNQSQSIGNPNKGVIHVSLSLKSDVKLNESENAWKPSRIRPVDMERDEAETQDIYKKIRSVLNKMTPQNFDKLILQVQSLNIDTQERLAGVINIVFEKALDEPIFSVTYALMCKKLAQIKVKMSKDDDTTENYAHFQKILLRQCQTEFEKGDTISVEQQKQIDDCTDPEKQKELLLNLAEEERKIRVRSVNNVRFIGELFKQDMLKSKSMMGCIEQLLHKVGEETLECLCKLLSTIGKTLEANKLDLSGYFKTMHNIIDNKSDKKISSRVRFMLQDVIELRQRNWIPRQIVQSAPKTIDQIQNEVDLEQSLSSYGGSNTPRRDDRPNNMNKRGGSKSVTHEGWMNASSRNSRNSRPQQFSVDSGQLSKIGALTTALPTSLQPPTHMLWSKGAAIKRDPSGPNSPLRKPPSMESHNMYNILGETGIDDAPKPNQRTGTYRAKGASIERSTFKDSFGKESIKQESLSSLLENIEDDLPKKVQVMMDHSQNDKAYGVLDKIERHFNIKENSSVMAIVKELLLWGLQYNKIENLQVIGEVAGHLVKDQKLTSEGLLEILKQVVDSSIDLFLDSEEGVWDLLASFIWAYMKKNPLTLNQIHTAVTKVIEVKKGYEFLLAFFRMKVKEQGNKVNALWENGKMELTDWFPERRVEEFTRELPLDCFGHKQIFSTEPALAQLLALMRDKVSRDNVETWIKNKIGEGVTCPWFIRALTEAVYTYTLCLNDNMKPRFDDEAKRRLETYYPLLITYVGNNEQRELQCLFALQHLLMKLEHPLGLTLQLFEYLWDSGEVISTEGFLIWETNSDPAEQEGKGVMLMTLTSFFTALKSCACSSDDDSL